MSEVLNPNLRFLLDNCPTTRICALQGGTRSGKTYSALQYLIDFADTYSGHVISVVRDTFPALRATVLRDFLDLMEQPGLFDPANEAKPSGYYEYEHNGNVIEFFSIDNEQKLRGRKRDILYFNEANEGTLSKFRQLMFRTTGRAIIDFNPSDADGYVREHVLTRPDCQTLITTYRDNPHLTPEIVAEIEMLKDADPDYWNVFGMGEFGKVSGQILGHYKVVLLGSLPIGQPKIYGLDFGYSAPSALVEVTPYDNAMYARQLIYRRKLTNPELITECIRLLPLTATIYADAAEPDRIEEFRKAGFKNIVAASKSIKDGLDMLRAKPLYIAEDSADLLSEIKQYRYRTDKQTGDATEDAVPTADHAIDAMRYAVFSHFRQPTKPKHRASVQHTPVGMIN